ALHAGAYRELVAHEILEGGVSRERGDAISWARVYQPYGFDPPRRLDDVQRRGGLSPRALGLRRERGEPVQPSEVLFGIGLRQSGLPRRAYQRFCHRTIPVLVNKRIKT